MKNDVKPIGLVFSFYKASHNFPFVTCFPPGAADKKLSLKSPVSTNRDLPGNRDLLKVVRERTQSLLRSCYHTLANPC